MDRMDDAMLSTSPRGVVDMNACKWFLGLLAVVVTLTAPLASASAVEPIADANGPGQPYLVVVGVGAFKDTAIHPRPTADADAKALFNLLTGYSQGHAWRKLIVAPEDLHRRTIELIEEQTRRAQQGRPSRIFAKLNAVVDHRLIEALYRASQAGVPIDLVVRGICCLRPSVKGVSENIHVTSILGRYLEHSRVYYFHNNGQEEIYLGSADLMPRNLDHRVEVVFPLEKPEHIRHIRDNVLGTYLKDTLRARQMKADGSYQRAKPGEAPVDVQEWLMAYRSGRK